MKKISLILPLFAVAVLSVGCSPKTVYDDKEIVRIETVYIPGAIESSVNYTRIFDFESGSVMDEYVAGEAALDGLRAKYEAELEAKRAEYKADPSAFPDFGNAAEYDDYLLLSYEESLKNLDTLYNFPREVTTFTEIQAKVFVREAVSYGFYTWKDRYAADGYLMDTDIWRINVHFTDGTVKTTSFFNLDPAQVTELSNYEMIDSTFADYLGANIFIEI